MTGILKHIFKPIAFGAVGALLLSANASFAQQDDVPVNTRFGDWAIRCDAVTVTRNICRLLQEQVLRESNDLVVRMIGVPAADGGTVLLAQVPMGTYLPGGAVFRAESDEEAEQTEMTWQRCFGDICEAAILLSKDEADAIEAAGNVLFGYRAGPESDPIVTRINMAELGAGIDALRTSEE